MISLIVADLDGTLLRGDGTISSRTIEALNRCRAAGKRIVIATARAPRMAKYLPGDLLDLTWICCGGAEIHENGKRIYYNSIAPRSAMHILSELLASFPSCAVSIEADDQLFANGHLRQPWDYQIVDLESVVDKPVAKVLIDLTEFEDLEMLYWSIPDDCKLIVTDHGSLGQILAYSVSKMEALKWVLERWELSLENVIAFGDDTMDIDMIRECGIGVAMGNAIPEVKEVADIVTSSNDEDGVAEVLESMFLR